MNQKYPMRVFVDSLILIYWVNKTEKFYSKIEKIRKYSSNSDIIQELIISPLIEAEILSGKYGTCDWGKICESWILKETINISRNLIGSEEAVAKMQEILDEAKLKYNKLSKITNNDDDTFHYATAEKIEAVDYFLTIDKRFCNKMNNEARNISKATKIVTPDELLNIIERKQNSKPKPKLCEHNKNVRSFEKEKNGYI